jgi:hypothetical protein
VTQAEDAGRVDDAGEHGESEEQSRKRPVQIIDERAPKSALGRVRARFVRLRQGFAQNLMNGTFSQILDE